MNRKTIFIWLAASLLAACIGSGKDDAVNANGGGGEEGSLADYVVQGLSQKGPYITDSRVVIQELDDDLVPVGNVYETFITDDFGRYEASINVLSRYTEIIASGYYFNEITGELSNSIITLKALADLEENTDVNVNVLTTLSYRRIKHLIQQEGMVFVDAKRQSEVEVLNLFNIKDETVKDFDTLDISEEGSQNGVLVAISAMLQVNNSEAELSEFISKVGEDLETDGVVDDRDLIVKLERNCGDLNLRKIRENIETRYEDLGLSMTVANFEQYVYLRLTFSDQDAIVDPNTGLTWLKRSPGELAWDDASRYCDTIIVGELTDWRLPKIEELEQIYAYAKALIVNMNTDDYFEASYWSSTYGGYGPCEAEATDHYYVRHFDRDISETYCDYALHHFTCVHD